MQNLEEELSQIAIQKIIKGSKVSLRMVLKGIKEFRKHLEAMKENKDQLKKYGELNEFDYAELKGTYVSKGKDVNEIFISELTTSELVKIKKLLEKENVAFNVVNDITKEGEDAYQVRLFAAGDTQTMERIAGKLKRLEEDIEKHPEKYHDSFEARTAEAKKQQKVDLAKNKKQLEKIKQRVKGHEL